jgi:hypothetical protein
MQAQERVIETNLDIRNKKDIPKNRGELKTTTRILFDLAVQILVFWSILNDESSLNQYFTEFLKKFGFCRQLSLIWR